MEAKDAVILKIAGYGAAPPFAFLPIIFLFSAAGAILRNMNGFAGEKDKPPQTTVCGVYFVSMKPKGKRHVSPGFFVGLSMMCYTLGKANKTCLGERQLRGRIGKLL